MQPRITLAVTSSGSHGSKVVRHNIHLRSLSSKEVDYTGKLGLGVAVLEVAYNGWTLSSFNPLVAEAKFT